MSDVKVKVGADTAELTTGLSKANASVEGFAAKTTVAGRAAGAMKNSVVSAATAGKVAMGSLQAAMGPLLVAFGAFTGLKGLADAAGQINDLSQRFGESAETMQRVQAVADQSGTSIETVAKSMNKAELAAVKAAQGNTEMDEAFQTLGISAEEFMGLPMEDKLAAIASGYDENTNKAAALDAMTKIMGKSATDLIPMFNQGGEAITQMMNDAAVASSDSVGSIDEVQDRFGEMFRTITVWAMDALGGVIWLIDQMSIGIASAIAYVSNLGDGLGAAKQAYDDTMQAGLEMSEKKKADREERKNKSKSSNIAEIRKEAEEEEKAKEDAKAKAKEDKAAEKEVKSDTKDKEAADKKAVAEKLKAEKEADKAAKDSAKKDKKTSLDLATKDLDGSKDTLESLKKASGGVSSDQLRKIGGGFAKSDYKGISKEQVQMNKQLDLAQKQYDQLKLVVDALKGNTTTDGITS